MKRRKEITAVLREAVKPVSASVLASRFQVSRQIIVGDIALLRAGGMQIEATARGYVIKGGPGRVLRRIACNHNAAQMQQELYTIVDYGCEVVDVIIEHPIYNELTGALHLASRYDVDQFIERCKEADARPLSMLTEGIHLHTVSCPDEEVFEKLKEKLGKLGLLVE